MAIPSVVGTATGGRVGDGSFNVTPPAGADYWIALVAAGHEAVTAPSGWTLVKSWAEDGTSPTSDPGYWLFESTGAPGSSWSYAPSSATNPVAVLVRGYTGVTGTALMDQHSVTSPAATATDEARCVRAVFDLNDSTSPLGYPTAATLNRAQQVQPHQSGGWSASVGVAEQEVSAGSVGTAAWTVPAQYEPHALTLLLYGGTATPALAYAIVGAVTDEGFTVRTKTTNAAAVRVKVGTDEAVTEDVTYGTQNTPDGDGWCESVVTGLDPATQYHYMVEMEDTDETPHLTALMGSPRTLPTPGQPASFTLAFGSCDDPAEDITPAFARILARDPDLFFHLGDFGYPDSTSTSQASHLADLEAVLDDTEALRTLLATTPTTRVLSDHDSSDGGDPQIGAWTAPMLAANKQVFPYPTLPNSDALYHSFVVGRVRFIVTDHRTLTTSTSKMGTTQKAWFKERLVEPEPVKVWVQDSAWIVPDYDGEADQWKEFPEEREELGDYIAESAVGRVITIHGDIHGIAADDGSHNPWGGFPSLCAGPFRNTSSWKGTIDEPPEFTNLWSEGHHPAGEGTLVAQYGWVEVTDTGEEITIGFTGYDTSDVSRVTLEVVAPTPSSPTLKGRIGGSTVTFTGVAVRINGETVPVTGMAIRQGGVTVPLV